MIWFKVFEVWAIAKLLQSPTFHRAVRKVHKKVHEIKTGDKIYDPEEFSGLMRDGDKPKGADAKRFLKEFADELKDQFRGTTRK